MLSIQSRATSIMMTPSISTLPKHQQPPATFLKQKRPSFSFSQRRSSQTTCTSAGWQDVVSSSQGHAGYTVYSCSVPFPVVILQCSTRVLLKVRTEKQEIGNKPILPLSTSKKGVSSTGQHLTLLEMGLNSCWTLIPREYRLKVDSYAVTVWNILITVYAAQVARGQHKERVVDTYGTPKLHPFS